MILSYHPCFEADKNLLCAGREPGVDDLAAIRTADAVILPQGCCRALYKMARSNCQHVFPNFDARFNHRGKIGQIELFQKHHAFYPKTEFFRDSRGFAERYRDFPEKPIFDFPFVFKFDWGGDGDLVYQVRSTDHFADVLKAAREFENSGQKGFIIQEYIPADNRSLRVVVVGELFFSYWRIQHHAHHFLSNVSKDATIDYDLYPHMQESAVESVKEFCRLTKINLAGFDILFSSIAKAKRPLFLEINYYFGRRGLGGSETFYDLLNKEIMKWLESLGLALEKRTLN
jgi:ribosomal protein S6--L-glutamate ligase